MFELMVIKMVFLLLLLLLLQTAFTRKDATTSAPIHAVTCHPFIFLSQTKALSRDFHLGLDLEIK